MLLTEKPKAAPRPKVDKANSKRPLAQAKRGKEGGPGGKGPHKKHHKKGGKPGGRREEGGRPRGTPFNNPFADLMNLKK